MEKPFSTFKGFHFLQRNFVGKDFIGGFPGFLRIGLVNSHQHGVHRRCLRYENDVDLLLRQRIEKAA